MVRIGAHFRVDNPLDEAIARGADAAQFFLGDPQGWKGPVIPGGDPAAIKDAFAAADVDIYIHAPYVINVATRVTSRLPHTAGDVSLGAAVLRVTEDLRGRPVLDEDAGAGVALLVAQHGGEGGAVADPGRLLHVVRHDDDRVAGLDLVHEVLDAARRDRVQGRARLVHEHHVRLDGARAGDAPPLRLAPGQTQAGLVQPVLDLVPQGRLLQRPLDDLV